jgi:hypothetical protein
MDKIGTFRMVSPIKLHKKANDGVVDDIKGKNLAVKSLFPENKVKQEKIGEIQD